jgi:uncharacterized cupin superfamily protein
VGSSAAFSLSSSNNYLSSLTAPTVTAAPPPSPWWSTITSSAPQQKSSPVSTTLEQQPPPVTTVAAAVVDSSIFFHAPLSYFSRDKLLNKGPRQNADVGTPHEASRQLIEVGAMSAGSWLCSAGGWLSLRPRVTTEIFHVLSGRGCLTDADGVPHEFYEGDTVILPKGWCGRWDIYEDMHKLWCVMDHPAGSNSYNSEDSISDVILRVIVTPYKTLLASSIIYDVGPTTVGFGACKPGSYPIGCEKSEYFVVMDGLFFLTNSDGTARRCVPGDTIVLPEGWSGQLDVIKTMERLWVAEV